jgi:hypothetical protein
METLNKVSDEMPAASQPDVAEEVHFSLSTLASTPFSESPSAASGECSAIARDVNQLYDSNKH